MHLATAKRSTASDAPRSVGIGALLLVVALMTLTEFLLQRQLPRILLAGLLNLAVGSAMLIGPSAPRLVGILRWIALALALAYFALWIAE